MYPQTKIAIPIFQAKKEDVIKVAEDCIEKGADVLEFRIDALDNPNFKDIQEIIEEINFPMIATNRISSEGGSFKGTEEERIDILYQLESNQDNIIQDIHNRYILLEKYDTYLSDDFPLRKAISTLWWNCLEQLDTDNHLEFINNKISEINNCRKELYIENTLLKQENEILQQKKYYFWRWEEKNKDRERLADNLNEINKNNDTVAELEEQLNTLSKKHNIGIQLKEDICKMVKNNQIKDINMLYQSLISDYNTNDLNNYSEEEFIVMIKDITSSKLLQLEPMNNELINLNETLSKISISKSDNEIENDDNVYKEYNIIYKNEDNYEMEM